VTLPLLYLQGAGAPEDHYIIPPVFIGFADAFIYLRDNKRFDEEVHKILARTVRRVCAALYETSYAVIFVVTAV
jgi:hypothetical protein